MHVNLHLERLDPSKNLLEIDGVDFTRAVQADDFHIEHVDGRPRIRMTLTPKSVRLTGDVDIVLKRIEAEQAKRDDFGEESAP
jgi:hypothetical protein